MLDSLELRQEAQSIVLMHGFWDGVLPAQV